MHAIKETTTRPETFERFGDTWTLITERGDWCVYERNGKLGEHYTLGKWRDAKGAYAKPGARVFTGCIDSAHGETAWTYGPLYRPDWRARCLADALAKLAEMAARDEAKSVDAQEVGRAETVKWMRADSKTRS
jgi:hypothetical protein